VLLPLKLVGVPSFYVSYFDFRTFILQDGRALVLAAREAVKKPIETAKHRAILERIVGVAPNREEDEEWGDEGSGSNSDSPPDEASSKSRTLAGRVWQADHITEVWDGGGLATAEGNAQVLCTFCHADKTSRETSRRAAENRLEKHASRQAS